MGISQMAQRTLTEFFIEKGYVSSTYKNRSISLGKIRSILSQIFPEIIEDFDNGKITVKNLPAVCRKLDLEILEKKPRVEWVGPVYEEQQRAHNKSEKQKRKVKKRAEETILSATQYEKMLAKATEYPKYDWLASREFLNSYEWKHLRFIKLSTSNKKCECCGRGTDKGFILNVDHIKPRKLYPELALELDNLQILCDECNAGKSNFSIADFSNNK